MAFCFEDDGLSLGEVDIAGIRVVVDFWLEVEFLLDVDSCDDSGSCDDEVDVEFCSDAGSGVGIECCLCVVCVIDDMDD